jgi:hypothetical protein
MPLLEGNIGPTTYYLLFESIFLAEIWMNMVIGLTTVEIVQ